LPSDVKMNAPLRVPTSTRTLLIDQLLSALVPVADLPSDK
jgi:hypothetical protein